MDEVKNVDCLNIPVVRHREEPGEIPVVENGRKPWWIQHGRIRLPLAENRPHMFLKELSLHLERLRKELDLRRLGLPSKDMPDPGKVRDELLSGIRYYRELAGKAFNEQKTGFRRRLEALGDDLEKLLP